ncbi:XrtN system VIT domain-containing protein [Pedobacter sp. MC2016-24]|uniref:XrtN system VIT domain-containing protein n=1 Tax=Pedobacter sp. MC2016-24 TaxID=2780090 RepID=UPI00187E221D|nr:XrtN system VIT domain-containing protein [Pedobacter sp. MC2016-24]MBE9599151.1 XrtN system VIT domain-containing protein [Pedobacter sp. MC2016-24]
MKKFRSILLEDSFRLSGMIFILLSLAIFSIGAFLIPNSETELTSFFICYCITTVFTFAVLLRALGQYGWKISRAKLDHTVILLIFWLISAFAFNKEMSVFDNSASWVSTYICLAAATVLLALFQKELSIRVKYVLSFFMGTALVLFGYYAMYLLPLYIIGALAAIFLGLSVHVFIPFFLCIVILVYAYRFHRITPGLKYAFGAGIVLPLFILCGFLLQWINIQGKVVTVQEQNTSGNNILPDWANIAQALPHTSITEKFLKAGLVYTIPDKSSNWFWGDFGRNSFGEARKHDPMVMIASLLVGKIDLSDENRIQILKTVFDSRHLAEERLWSGDDLITSRVITEAKLYPEYRMAYTEKTLSIKNTNRNTWRGSQEAIYTFQLPEGSVVSSLSLWINGVEEHARLTTKGKADSAYHQIVGVENRDPSVVHWQEGNQVTVRVFPCAIEEDRKFKIGITSPMLLENGRLIYQNSSFKGPSPNRADEKVRLSFSSVPKSIDTDLSGIGLTYTDNRTYQNDWQLSMNSVPLAKAGFSFAGKSYKIKESADINTFFKPDYIYLDINNTWTKAELTNLWANIKSHRVYAFDQQLLELNEKNIWSTFDKLSQLNFSLFPLYTIPDVEKSVVITKCNSQSPNLSDLDQSKFYTSSKSFLSKAIPIHVYNIGQNLNPYLQTLKQFNLLRYTTGTIAQFNQQVQQNRFPEQQELDNAISIKSSRLMIQESADTTSDQAPDHLLRLFAYHKILRNISATYFQKDYTNPDLLKNADQAFIVSPVSSLIVLETKKDYERFDIDESKNSLKNASIQSSGAAPEPHEWVLIILCTSIMIYVYCQSVHFKKLRSKWAV